MSTKSTIKFYGSLYCGVHIYKDGLDIEDQLHVDLLLWRKRLKLK